MNQFKRWKTRDPPSHKWKGGSGIKLEGSDHAPVCLSSTEIPNTPQHNTPTLSARYCLQVYGCQQTIVSLLLGKPSAAKVKNSGYSRSLSGTDDFCEGLANGTSHSTVLSLKSNLASAGACVKTRKKTRQSRGSQLFLKSFFQTTSSSHETFQSLCNDIKLSQKNVASSVCFSNGSPVHLLRKTMSLLIPNLQKKRNVIVLH